VAFGVFVAWKDVGMLRLIAICAAVVFGCVLVGGYLAGSDSPIQSLLSKGSEIASASSANDHTVKHASADAADEEGSDDDSDSSKVADAAPDDEDTGGATTTPDKWTPGELPGGPGK